MKETKIKFYKNKVAINCLAKDLTNAKDVVSAAEDHVCVGILSSQFKDVKEGVTVVKEWLKALPSVSVGLGDGNPAYSLRAAEIAGETDPGHVNQTFPFSGYTAGYLVAKGASKTYTNALISPTGVIGKVKINTGVKSSSITEGGIIDARSAVALIMDMGVQSVKFYHMKGLTHIDEFVHVAKICAEEGLDLIEPTGGITEDNILQIVDAALQAGVKRCMPHIYTSIIDKNTGITDASAIKRIYNGIKNLVK